VIQRYGSARVKRMLWNKEFASGRWDCLESTPGDCVYPFIERYSQSGAVLDLGCGSGSTGNELDYGAYTLYTGVDISDAAIDKSVARTRQNGRDGKNDYYQGDIFRYQPTRPYDVILFRDSLYYIPHSNVKSMLDRYAQHLTGHGVFIVRMASGGENYRTFVQIIERNFVVLEKVFFEKLDALVFVFRAEANHR